MLKILLCCSAGMSTSLLVTKMQAAAKEQGIECSIQAMAEGEVKNHEDEMDVLLLGPQVRFLFNKIEEDCIPLNIPIAPIEPASYGAMDGEKVLKQAIRLIKGNSK